MQLRTLKPAMIALLFALLLSSCVTVKEYQMSRVNDSQMVLSNRKVEQEELDFQLIKEGSSGATSGKSGGGCGCN